MISFFPPIVIYICSANLFQRVKTKKPIFTQILSTQKWAYVYKFISKKWYFFSIILIEHKAQPRFCQIYLNNFIINFLMPQWLFTLRSCFKSKIMHSIVIFVKTRFVKYCFDKIKIPQRKRFTLRDKMLTFVRMTIHIG